MAPATSTKTDSTIAGIPHITVSFTLLAVKCTQKNGAEQIVAPQKQARTSHREDFLSFISTTPFGEMDVRRAPHVSTKFIQRGDFL